MCRQIFAVKFLYSDNPVLNLIIWTSVKALLPSPFSVFGHSCTDFILCRFTVNVLKNSSQTIPSEPGTPGWMVYGVGRKFTPALFPTTFVPFQKVTVTWLLPSIILATVSALHNPIHNLYPHNPARPLPFVFLSTVSTRLNPTHSLYPPQSYPQSVLRNPIHRFTLHNLSKVSTIRNLFHNHIHSLYPSESYPLSLTSTILPIVSTSIILSTVPTLRNLIHNPPYHP